MTGWIMSEHGVENSKLIVIKMAEPSFDSTGHKRTRWLCRCECGKELIINGHALRSGNSKSCGCVRKEKLIQRNISNSSVHVGDVYGKLTVIKDLGMRQQKARNKNERWSLCQCSCGSAPIEVKNNMLQSGWKKSCGCLHSYGEFIIRKMLEENHINFIEQYSFPDLVGKNNGLLRFDFAVFEDAKLQYLIEYDGKQHFFGPEGKWTNGASLEDIQYHDELKNHYCINHNIVLKRIPYQDLKKFNFQDIISNKYNI